MKNLAIAFTFVVHFLLPALPNKVANKVDMPNNLPAKNHTHSSLRIKQPPAITNLLFTDEQGRQYRLIDNTKKLNIIVFWASWCGPCRMEIPGLKDIYAKVDTAKIRLISISVDKEKADWLKAMKEENMPWPQVLAEGDNLASIKKDFGFKGIPQIYFIDGKGNVLESYEGYHYDNNAGLTAIVTRLGNK